MINALCLAIIVVAVSCATIHNNKDLNVGSSPGGTSCSHASTYDLVGNSRGPLYLGFPIDDVPQYISNAKFYLKGVRCANSDRLSFSLFTMEDASADFDETGGINNECPFITSNPPTSFNMNDDDCINSGVDITAALRAAKQASNSFLVLSLMNGIKNDESEPNFCNPFLNPDAENKYNNNSNCGVLANSREIEPSSFYITYEPAVCLAIACLCGGSIGPDGCIDQCFPCSTDVPTTNAPTTTGVVCPAIACTCGQIDVPGGCPICKECTTTAEPTVQETCPPCLCGSDDIKRRSGCPICKPCTPSTTPVACPLIGCVCGSEPGPDGCPRCLPCTTTEPSVQGSCPPCPCGSQAKRRTGCPVCKPCTTKAPTTTGVVCPAIACTCGQTDVPGGCPVCKPCTSRNCWDCASGWVHWWEVPYDKEPDDKCACVRPQTSSPVTTTAEPSTTKSGGPTTKSPGSNISGENNARTSDASNMPYTLGIVASIVLVIML